jgi:hypothetical protein
MANEHFSIARLRYVLGDMPGDSGKQQAKDKSTKRAQLKLKLFND